MLIVDKNLLCLVKRFLSTEKGGYAYSNNQSAKLWYSTELNFPIEQWANSELRQCHANVAWFASQRKGCAEWNFHWKRSRLLHRSSTCAAHKCARLLTQFSGHTPVELKPRTISIPQQKMICRGGLTSLDADQKSSIRESNWYTGVKQ